MGQSAPIITIASQTPLLESIRSMWNYNYLMHPRKNSKIMKLSLTILFFLFSITSYCQTYRTNRKTVYRDTSNNIIKEKGFYELLKSRKYIVQPVFDTVKNKVIEIRLIKKPNIVGS